MSSTSRSSRVAPAEAASALEDHLGYWLRIVSNHVSHAFKVRVESLGVTVAEWVVLRKLYEREGVRPSDLSDGLGLTRGAVSKLLDRLAGKGLVRVRADAGDGRAQVVTLSASGRGLVPRLAALADENDAAAFGHLSEPERAALRATLRGVVARLGLSAAPVE